MALLLLVKSVKTFGIFRLVVAFLQVWETRLLALAYEMRDANFTVYFTVYSCLCKCFTRGRRVKRSYLLTSPMPTGKSYVVFSCVQSSVESFICSDQAIIPLSLGVPYNKHQNHINALKFPPSRKDTRPFQNTSRIISHCVQPSYV